MQGYTERAKTAKGVSKSRRTRERENVVHPSKCQRNMGHC